MAADKLIFPDFPAAVPGEAAVHGGAGIRGERRCRREGGEGVGGLGKGGEGAGCDGFQEERGGQGVGGTAGVGDQEGGGG